MPVDLGDVVMTALDATGYALRNSEIEITTDFDQDLPKDIGTITLSYTIFDVTEMAGDAINEPFSLLRAMTLGSAFDAVSTVTSPCLLLK